MADKSVSLNKAQEVKARQTADRVLASETWTQADRLRRFLRYLVDHALSGTNRRLNQFSIALDVFDRDASFDPNIDAIVRVEAGRLRSKLLEYYDGDGRDDEVRIALPKRGYALFFQFEEAVNPAPEKAHGEAPQTTPIGPLNVRDPTIAVLPFDNMSADTEQEYFSDGITEDLITDLSRLSGLSVIARQSTFTYKGIATDVTKVSAQLGADFIVEGSVRKFGGRIRINAQLIHGQTGNHIWAERFDRDYSDIFELQDSVNRKIVDALRLQLSNVSQSRLQRKRTEVVEAYDYLLRGIMEAGKYTREGAAKAQYCFASALELDPGYATAYGRLSLNAVYQWIGGWSNSFSATVERGVGLAEQAVALDDGDSFAHAALCWAFLWNERHDEAIFAGEKAVALDTNDVAALERLSFALAWSGKAEEALQHLAKAQILNPLHGYHFPTGVCHFVLGRYAPAVESLRSSINGNPTFLPGYLYLVASLSLLGQVDDARSLVAIIKKLDPSYRPAELRHANFKHKAEKERFFSAIAQVIDD